KSPYSHQGTGHRRFYPFGQLYNLRASTTGYTATSYTYNGTFAFYYSFSYPFNLPGMPHIGGSITPYENRTRLSVINCACRHIFREVNKHGTRPSCGGNVE